MKNWKNLKNGFKVAILGLLLIWGVFIFNILRPELQWGVLPRIPSKESGLGILFSPLFHGSLGHIVANSIPLAILLFTLCVSYPRLAFWVVTCSVLLGNGLVWLFARNAEVIGASGLIYSLIGFLLFNVIFRRDWRSLLVALIVGFLYSGALLGVLPSDPRISWEGHLFGLLVGILLSYLLRKEVAK
jgi:membrane associated rhomboid family serine protease